MTCSLNKFYKAIGVTKQNVYAQLKRAYYRQSIEQNIVYLITAIREVHPTMGMREMYFKMKPDQLGRDTFEDLCRRAGFKLPVRKNYRITTDSSNTRFFPNLIENLLIVRMNQVWQSDITFFELLGRFYFITLIQDAYTKVIVGYSVSISLRTEDTTLVALKMALKQLKGVTLKSLIFHSDGGGQYYQKEFLELTRDFQNSMGKSCYENAMAESLNNVIKNKYLVHRRITSFKDLCKEVARTVETYNSDKPHSGLHRMTPFEFEKKIIFDMQFKAKMTESYDAEVQSGIGHRALSTLLQSKAQTPDVYSAE